MKCETCGKEYDMFPFECSKCGAPMLNIKRPRRALTMEADDRLSLISVTSEDFDSPKSKRVKVSVTEIEQEALQRAAQQARLSISGYIRKRLFERP